MASGSFLKAMHSGIHFLKLSYVHQHPNCKSTEGQPTNPKNPCIMEYLHFLGVFAGVLRVCLSVFKVQATHLSLSLSISPAWAFYSTSAKRGIRERHSCSKRKFKDCRATNANGLQSRYVFQVYGLVTVSQGLQGNNTG